MIEGPHRQHAEGEVCADQRGRDRCDGSVAASGHHQPTSGDGLVGERTQISPV